MKNSKWILLIVICLILGGCSIIKKPADEAVHTQSQTHTQETASYMEPTRTEPKETNTEPDTERIEEPEDGIVCEIIIATDIHYLASELTDYGPNFMQMVEHGDGKVVTYVDQITEAFLEEVLEKRPDVLILSGDLSLNGERLSHEELAKKLEVVEKSGIPVLVIPGNHDINNPAAAGFLGNESYPAEFTTPEMFQTIYGPYGYQDSIYQDSNSLSYVYQLDDGNRIMMLDSCQYEPYCKVGGMIRPGTYEWIEEQLELAWNEGMDVIPISHHNLLDESEIYVDDCTIEHSEQLIDLLEAWEIPLYLSGHLHVQHTMRSNGDEGIYEMVTGSLATPPCQYGILQLLDDGTSRYHTQKVDIEGWAGREESLDANLLQFTEFRETFLQQVFYNQSYDKMEQMDISEDKKDQMSNLYALLNAAYYAGNAVEVKDKVLKDPAYAMWEEYMFHSILLQYVQSIVNDADQDYNRAVIE